ncbi:MAG: hypothetical protein BGO11_15370 [Solirubrobacterales bacterium 70-9]|nr:MAG: hypothetical protein BGO11_15370 [Solirubrobacterales bacterium 70-9]
MRNARQISRRLALLGSAILALGALFAAVGADAAGTFAAHAQRPAYDASALELRGHGGYTTARKHSELRVTVCLQKRLGGRAFSIRCETGTGAGRRVTAEVSVPGCVKGSWRTTSTGEALNPKGEWVHQASATSAPYTC